MVRFAVFLVPQIQMILAAGVLLTIAEITLFLKR